MSEDRTTKATYTLQHVIAVFVVLLAGLFLIPAQAQQEEEGAWEVEEVLVTARRREERLQDTPISVSAFSADAIKERSLNELGDIDQYVPNLVHTESAQGGSGAIYRIRGAGLDDPVATNEPSVGLYLDGVYIGRVAGAALDTLEIEQVEVLRGPQGTLFGRNTIGGAINVITEAPDDEFGGSIEGTIGSRDRYDVRATMNVPLGEGLALRGGILYHEEDGWVKSLDDGDTFGDEKRFAGRFALAYTPNDTFKLRLNADFTTDDGEADPSVAIMYLPHTFIPPGFAVEENNSRTHSGFRPGNELDVFGVAADWSWDFGQAELRSVTSYREMEHYSGIDFDGTPFNFFDQLNDTASQDQFSQEFHLLGENDGLNYLVGAFYFSENIDQIFYYPLGAVMLAENNQSDNKNVGAFVNLDYQVSDRWNISAGLRYTEEDKEIFYNHNIQVPGPNGVVGGLLTQPLTDIAAEFSSYPPGTDLDRELSFDATTWRVSADYKLSDNVMVFASISEGFRSGGFNGRVIANPVVLDKTFGPETLRAYEAGFKSDSEDGRYRLNGTVFFSDYTDMQFSAILEGSPSVITDNAGASEIFGVELEGHAYLSEALRLDYSLGYMDAEFTKLSEAVIANGIDLDDPIGLTPEWSYNIGMRYEHDMGQQGVVLMRGDYTYTSEYTFLPQANEFDIQEGFGLLNLRVSYQPQEGNWELSAFGLNVLDKKYSYFKEDLGASFLGVILDFPAPGFEWGVTATYRF